MLSDLNLSNGYPKTSDFNTKVDLRFYGSWAEVMEVFPKEGDLYPRVDQEPGFASYVCTDAKLEYDKVKQLTYLALRYQDNTAPGVAAGITDRQIKCSFSDDGLAKMIEKHDSFKTHWKYDLIHKDSHTITASPTWILTSKTVLVATADKENWKWVEHGTVPPEGWSVYFEAIKSEAAQYIVSAPTVTQRQYFKQDAAAEAAAKYVGTHVVPHKTYGKGSTASKWLVLGGVTIEEENGWFVVQFTATYADEWDTDIYP